MSDRTRVPRFGKYFSPWLVIGLSAILAVAVGVLAWVNYDREKDYMARILSEKGAALIKSFEAGARTGMMGTFGGDIRLQTLLEETAAQPDILFIALTDRQGRILAHNDPARVGTELTSPQAMAALNADEDVQWSIASDDQGREAFTVYSDFLPVMRFGRGPEGLFRSMRDMHQRMFPGTDDGQAGEGPMRGRRWGQMRNDQMRNGHENGHWPNGHMPSGQMPRGQMSDATGQEGLTREELRQRIRDDIRARIEEQMQRGAAPSGQTARPGTPGAQAGQGGNAVPNGTVVPDDTGAPDDTGVPAGAGSQSGADARTRSFPCQPGWFGSFQPERLLNPEQRPVIFIGMDVAPFKQARAEDMRIMIVTSLTVLLLGVAGVVSLFWAQGYARSRKQLADARSFAAEVVSSLPAGLVFAGPDGRITYANETAHELLGLGEDAVGRQADDILPRRVLDMFDDLSDERTIIERGMELDGADGDVPVDASASRILSEDGEFLGRLVFLKDLSEIRRLEQEVRRREKLAAVGNLAAGVAHEVRNPLSSIKGYATYFGSLFDDGSENRKAAEIMAAETDRLNRVITELLEFARPSELSTRPVDAATLVDNTLRLIRQDAEAAGVRVQTEVRPDASGETPVIEGDADRLTQALLNLCINGVQATPRGGSLTVSALRADDRVLLRVADTGRGIAHEDLSKMFDPYFTTKAAGTGLGLAVVQKIVEAHGGDIAVKSVPGKGTEVTVSLPAAKEGA